MTLQQSVLPTTLPIRTSSESSSLVSVIIPVFNERNTIMRIIDTVLQVPLDLEVIVVDDGSSDGTAKLLGELSGTKSRVTVLFHPKNRGKGAAIRTGIDVARGTFTVIQDADLEYDPNDLVAVVAPLMAGESRVVYGSRYLTKNAKEPFRLFRYGVTFLNAVVRVLYRCRLTDSATCYKAAPTDLLRSLELECNRFEFCPELTSKLCRLGVPITEVPIGYVPRSAKEGKKIRARDGWDAFLTYWKFRKWNPRG